ncbi:MAG TPA: prenyltransferase/squalene oxidase repeat-containing protein [Solirubrobacteraceae bacterium]|nr:prenyltransferase/squalene oxidase repeat-containing protein [Solirubrobacteraceae bacterium]
MTWSIASLALLAAALAVGFAWYERSRPSARVLALVATLAALAALGRVAFAPLPNVKPTTDIVLISGYVLGGAPGFAVGAVAAISSNLFFGEGPWTPWQMLAWGGVGIGGAVLARITRHHLGRVGLAFVCALAGLAFGIVMNLYTWITFSGEHTLSQFAFLYGRGIPFDIAHAVGNALFALAFGPALVRSLERFRARFEVHWKAVPGSLAGLAAAAAVALGAFAEPAHARAAPAGSAHRSIGYLDRAQNTDGGFGGSPGEASTGLYTGWVALGLEAAGRNPGDVRHGGPSAIDFIRSDADSIKDTGAIERTILVLAGAGVSPNDFAGHDLVADLQAHQQPDGSYDGQVNLTAFAILALRGAGEGRSASDVRTAAAWLASQQGDDGGFNFATKGGGSGIDETGSALEALAAGGRRGSATSARAVRFVAAHQNADGGFPLRPGDASNAQSTAWAIQGLIAAGRKPERVRHGGRNPIAYLRSVSARDGSVHYSRSSNQTPVWVTGQALTALARAPFPIAVVPRRSHRSAVAPGVAAARSRTAPRRGSKRAQQAAPVTPRPAGLDPRTEARALVTARRMGVAAGIVLAPLTA